MKKILGIIVVIFGMIFLSACTNEQMVGLANPWSNCNDDLVQAAKIAGFKFPLLLSNYQVRAMKGMIEITYPLEELRYVTVRKSETNKGGDISGVYNKYPINKEVIIKNGVPIQIRADENKIYVMNMSASTGYYSAYCEKGMSMREINGIYEVIRAAEEPKLPPEAFK